MQLRYCKHVICQTCMQHWQCLTCQHRERLCDGEHLIQSIYHFWFLKQHHSAATHHHHRRWETCCRTQEYCMHAEYLFFIFCSMYLVLFSIVLYRTIVTVYTDNIFLYNYLCQMNQIIHLSLVGCFTPA